MRQHQPIGVWIAIGTAALILGAVALLVWLQNATVVWPQMDSWVPVDSRTILVRVYVANCSWTRVGTITESATAVRVSVDTLPCPIAGTGSDSLDLREITARLPDDIGARTVEDANGQPIPSR